MERGFVFDNSFDNSEFSNDTLPLAGVTTPGRTFDRFEDSRGFMTVSRWLRKLFQVAGLRFQVLGGGPEPGFSTPNFWHRHFTRMCTSVKYPKLTTPRVRIRGRGARIEG